jgi:hypothetical protein
MPTSLSCLVQREVIDDSLGQAYSVTVADVEGSMSHLLVTTHEYLPVPSSSGFGLGSGKWSYMSDSMAPRESPEVNVRQSLLRVSHQVDVNVLCRNLCKLLFPM